MKISEVKIITLGEPEPLGPRPGWVTTPTDLLFPGEHRPNVPPPGTPSSVIVRVETDEEIYGYGTVGLGSPAAVPVIKSHLEPLVIGRSPFDVEFLWELMYRSTINIGRKGLVLEAISAIDIALWDIMGKATGQPVYNLLGGKTKDRLRAYVSQNYAQRDLGAVRAEAQRYVDQGFTALKMRFGYGPGDGASGMAANYELIKTVRDVIGPDVDLMADAYMGWDVAYAIRMIRRVDELDLRWIEEPVIPDDIEGYARIRSAVSTPISGGEHEFTRWGFRQLLEARAVDVVQPDVNRMGGITEARKVWALASAFNVEVIPHSNHAHNVHLITASTSSPLIEYFPTDTIRSSYTFFPEIFVGEPEVKNGFIAISDAPGLGIELNEETIARYRIAELSS